MGPTTPHPIGKDVCDLTKYMGCEMPLIKADYVISLISLVSILLPFSKFLSNMKLYMLFGKI